LERVRRRASKRLEGFEGIGYKNRLQELGLMTLKILSGMAGAVEGMGLVRDEGGRRGHDHK